MAVEIIGDPARLLETPTEALVVVEVSDYVPGVQHIKRAVAEGEGLQVVVQNPVCAVWLERMADSYNDSDVRYSQVSARDLLATRWQTEVPERISDDDILTSGFLEAEIVPRTGQLYEEIVLEYYWGEFFTYHRFPASFAGELVENVDLLRWEQNKKLPLAMDALRLCRERWLGYTKDNKTRAFIEAVFENPEALRRNIASYKLLRDYPAELGKDLLDDWYSIFVGLDLDPEPVSLEEQEITNTTQEIRYYLNSLAPHINSVEDLIAVLNQLSGWLMEELEWVSQFLQLEDQRIQPNSELVKLIASRFRPIHTEIEEQLQTLESVISPKYPVDPTKNKSIDDWLTWALEEYLPYRFWLEENDRFDDVVADFASAYADWFYTNYVDHKYQEQDRWVFHVLNPALASIKSGRKVLFIVIDNFNYKFLRRLLDLFREEDFHLAEGVQPSWSLIPTATEISKWSLVAGEADVSNVRGKNYESILDKDWQGHFAGHKVAYLPKIGVLKKRRDFPEDLLLLNYLPVDAVLHKDEEQIGSTHAQEIQGYLKTMVKEVVRFAKRTKVEENLDIFITSDHGSTKIPASVDNVLDDAFYRKQAKDKHHRYISVPSDRVMNPTSYDVEHCYIVQSEYMGTREEYFIAKRYDRFISTRESVYVHGGLTPEETIVPFFRLTKTAVVVLQPTIRLPDNMVRVSVKFELNFMVGNPNDHDIVNLELSVRESDMPGVEVEKILAGQSSGIALPTRIKRRPGTTDLDKITVEGSYEYRGQRYKIEAVQIPVEVKTLAESKTDFDFNI